MLALCSPQVEVEPAIAWQPGAFAWWYLDLLDERGGGLVLIWSIGLPFLPAVSSALQRGDLPAPEAHPSLSIALYREGRQVFYILQQHPLSGWDWQAQRRRWRIGDSTIQIEDEPGGATTLLASLDCPIPGSRERLAGTVTLSGNLRHGGDVTDSGTSHRWTPLIAPARGAARLRWGSESFQVDGRAYLDRNRSLEPLPELGIHRWCWGRLPLPDRELAWYHLEPVETGRKAQQIVLEVQPDGRSRVLPEAPIELEQHRRGRYGLLCPRRVRFADPDGSTVEVELAHMLEDGPFYQRFLVRARSGPSVLGMGELVAPDRMDLPWLRPLVPMRVHTVGGPNSFWLPLFCGGGSKLRRLLGQLRQPAALPVAHAG